MPEYKAMLNPRINIFMLKPDGVSRGLDDIIKKELIKSGFRILAFEKKNLTTEEIKKLYLTSFRRDYPLGENDERAIPHIEFMQKNASLAFLVEHPTLEKEELYLQSRKLRGDTWLPWKCNPESIRFRYFSGDIIEPIFNSNMHLLTPPPNNVIHATLSDEEFDNAFEVFFKNITDEHIYSRYVEKFSPKSLDLALVSTFAHSSSDRFKIKEHNGISQLASYLKSKGFNILVSAFADETVEEAARELIAKHPRIIGFTSVASEFSYIKRLSSKVRELDSSIMLVAGGPHFSLNPYDISFTDFDAVCVGEGEYPLTELLTKGNLENIPGWIYRSGNKILRNAPRPWINNISELPLADHEAWDIFEGQNYNHKRIVISRGCPFLCTYCSNEALSNVTTGKYVRFRNPKSIDLEIASVIEHYPNTEFIFLESEALIPKIADVKGIVEVTKKYASKISFGTNIRIGTFDEAFLSEIRSGGFTFANLGLESGSERIRKDILNRKYSNDTVREVFRMARKHSININTYNMLGLPTETPEDFEETIKLNLECNPSEAQLAIFFPYPGTELYSKSIELGFLDNPFFYHKYEGKERRDTALHQPQMSRDNVLSLYDRFRSIFG